ncbi:MAG: C39 family peptidase [Anaerotignum sp.]|nr:C39 family peptidase [Anaerotignum sp.]MDY3927411.1 C39 family peptidase [Anaerotignum sp.]
MKRPVKYLQTDKRWAGNDYSAGGDGSTIGNAGCGPTSAAMVIATWKDRSITPASTAAWSKVHGYKAPNQGTYYSYFAPQMAKFGIRCQQLNFTNLRNLNKLEAAVYHEKALRAVQRGDMVICCMGPGLWTTSGHFILWWNVTGDMVHINDSASNRADRELAQLERLQREVKYYFVCEKPEATEEDEEEMRYKTLNDIPEKNDFRKIIKTLMDAKIIGGDGEGNIELSHDMVRGFVINYRGGAYDRKLMQMGMEPAVKE